MLLAIWGIYNRSWCYQHGGTVADADRLAVALRQWRRPGDWKAVDTIPLLLLGRGKMLQPEETHAVFKRLPGAKLGILSGTPNLTARSTDTYRHAT